MKTCDVCGAHFSPQNKRQHLCSTSCRGKWLNWQKPPRVPEAFPCVGCGEIVLTKGRNPHVVRCPMCKSQVCPICDKRFTTEHRIRQQYCSLPCARIGYQKPESWQHLRRDVRRRDGGACQHCGTKDGLMHVHHVIPRKEWTGEGSPDRLDNLILLCGPCHRTHHSENFSDDAREESSRIMRLVTQAGWKWYREQKAKGNL